MAGVLGMDATTSGIRAWLGFTSGSVALVAGILTAAGMVGWLHARHRATPEASPEIPLLVDNPPPHLPTPTPPTARPGEHLRQDPVPRAHAASTAKASRLPSAELQREGPVDLTDDPIDAPRRDPPGSPDPGHEATGHGRPLDSPGRVQAPDRSRPASLAGASSWSCPFPPEADAAQADEAYVTLEVTVGPDGVATGTRVLADPGNGFGREARRCAMRERYGVALDREGNAVAGTTRPFRVHFSR